MFETLGLNKRVFPAGEMYKYETGFDEWIHDCIMSSFPQNSLASLLMSEFCSHVYRLIDSGHFDKVAFEDIEEVINEIASDYVSHVTISAKAFKPNKSEVLR